MRFAHKPHPESLASLADAALLPFWLDDPARPQPVSALTRSIQADLVIIGAGFTGLWAALLAKETEPSRTVVVLEAGECASGASGRNGGFVAASLTHGFDNGLERWPNELAELNRLGLANLEAIEQTVARLGIDCDFLRSGELVVATEPYQTVEMRPVPTQAAPYGEKLSWLEGEQVRALVNSPTYLGALYDSQGVALVNPARLAWGLRQACLDLGVQLYENTPATRLEEVELVQRGRAVVVHTPYGRVRAARAALATNAFPPLLNRLSHYIVPVYDYALMSEPLSSAQQTEIAWQGRQGISDAANQFHYYRMTADHRILWGGYDAVYYWNNGFGAHHESNPETFGRLAEHFFQTFPQLAGLRFTHAWGGAIDTCSRFSVFWGTAHHGRTAYAAGYTGLGVGAARFGALVLLDLLGWTPDDDRTKAQRINLEMVRSKPIPFPPEPLRSGVINLTRWSLQQADHNQGRRNFWLQILDRLGLGFDS